MTDTARQDQSTPSTTSSTRTHLIGLLLGAEEDWPQAFEAIARARRPGHHDASGVVHDVEPSGSPSSRSS